MADFDQWEPTLPLAPAAHGLVLALASQAGSLRRLHGLRIKDMYADGKVLGRARLNLSSLAPAELGMRVVCDSHDLLGHGDGV